MKIPVEKGEIIARFDAERIQRESREEELELLKLEQDIMVTCFTARAEAEVESIKPLLDMSSNLLIALRLTT